jgi:hypothetical protein
MVSPGAHASDGPGRPEDVRLPGDAGRRAKYRRPQYATGAPRVRVRPRRRWGSSRASTSSSWCPSVFSPRPRAGRARIPGAPEQGPGHDPT